MFTKRIPPEVRFRSKVQISPECWVWTGALNGSGYGTIGLRDPVRKSVLAHRFSFELHRHPIPQGMLVCHTCDNRKCVNPDHLFIGTVQDNNADRDRKGRCRGTSRPGEACGKSKLTDAKVLAIRADGRIGRLIAKDYGVCVATIRHIKSGRIWRHLLTLPESQNAERTKG